MGGCVSTPRGCASRSRVKRSGNKKRRWRGVVKKKNKNRVFGNSKFSSSDVVVVVVEHSDSSIAGSAAEVWFEPASLFGSDSEDEFHSGPEDMLSSNASSPNNAKNQVVVVVVVDDDVSSTIGKNVTREKDESSSALPHSSFPCINTSVSIDKRRSGTSSPMSARKKVVPEHPFMSLEGQSDVVLPFLKMLQKRPVAGSQFPLCPRGKEMFDSWSPIEPNTFRVRGMNYLRDKKKEHASNKAAYYPFGVDVYLSHRKISHIARLVELPAISSSPILPSLLVVNVQIPLYPPSIFQNENDGEGMNVVMYFKLSDKFEKELPLYFQESIKRLIDDEVEKVKGFPTDTTVPFRERLKILGRVSNVDDLQLNVPQRKLMHAYNEKPILSRPQHEFYTGENYFEIDLDMHRFNYISRKGFDAFQDKLKICILDIGLTIQGNKVEELPEQVLCCIRINGIDHRNYHHLEPSEKML
ncbi:hypothetical protein QQ045_031134 [Rhodiola kirilowii]